MAFKVLVAHPGRQHSYRLVEALNNIGYLDKYITTIYYKKTSFLFKLLRMVLHGSALKRANSRRISKLDDRNILQFNVLGGLAETFLARFDKSHRVYDFVREYNSARFGRKVAKIAIDRKIDAVVMYDDNAFDCFEYLHRNAPHIIKILDVSIAAKPYIKEIYEQEITKTRTSILRKESPNLWRECFIKKSLGEISFADYFLVPSPFVKDSLSFFGISDTAMLRVPYGSNSQMQSSNYHREENELVHFLFVGQVTYRKGIPYLLEAFTQLGHRAFLTIVGACHNADLLHKASSDKDDNIVFTGMLNFEEVESLYAQSDAFILPSFAEGMAQVVLEALSKGLPVITTYNAGVSEIIQDGYNGFLVPPGDSTSLKEKLEWIITNRSKLPAMRENARNSAKDYTWSCYNKHVERAFDKIRRDYEQTGKN